MLISNTDFITGREIIETIDIARGSTVRARNLGRDIFAGLKNLVGGESLLLFLLLSTLSG